MPLYEYRCRDCGSEFEVLQKMSDEPLTKCRTCDTGSVEKLLSRSAFQFKGSGWYVTDYAAKKPGSDAKSGGSDGKSEGSNGKSEGTEASSSSADSGASKSTAGADSSSSTASSESSSSTAPSTDGKAKASSAPKSSD